ncbi:MAG: FG-GAP-like repeat-containing protein [Nitrospirota bacterium]|nr:FG-GAP-like repeat-containing protein [Nitrospirota bacterium]
MFFLNRWSILKAVLHAVILTVMTVSTVFAVESGQTAPKKSSGLGGEGSGGSGSVVPDLSTGSFSYSIPIEVPAGRKGMNPNLSLIYNSTNGRSWVGYGWELESGAIERNNKSGVDYSKEDYILRMGGATSELIKIETNELGQPVTNEFRVKIEGAFFLIKKVAATNSWELIDKKGVHYYFGQTTLSRLDNPANANEIFKWCLDRVEDTNGNYMTLSYNKTYLQIPWALPDDAQLYLKEIAYAGNTNTGLLPTVNVKFYTELNYDKTDSGSSNFRVRTAYRLKSIDISANGNRVRAYRLRYDVDPGATGNQNSPSSGRYLLTSVEQYGSDADVSPTTGDVTGSSLPATTFSYPLNTNGFSVQEWTGMPNWGDAAYTWVGDFDGDGMMDIATATANGTAIWIKHSQGMTSSQYFVEEQWASGLNTIGPSNFTWAGDFDGDGKTDIATIVNGIVRVRLSRPDNPLGSRFVEQPWSTTITTYYGGMTWAGDFNGDGKTDIAYGVPGSGSWNIWVLASNGAGFDSPQVWQSNSVNWGTTLLGDFNGDGKTDIATYAGGTIWLKVARPDLPSGQRFPETATTNVPSWGQSVWVGDFNGDGRMDIATGTINGLFGGPGTLWVKISTGNYFIEQLWWSGTYTPLIIPNSEWIGDFNGDGRTDIASLYSNSQISIKQSTGFSFTEQLYTVSGLWSDGGYNWAGDFNGDGKDDLATGWYGSIWIRKANVFQVDRLTSIKDSMGSTTTIQYDCSTDFRWNNTLMPFPVQTVSEIRVNDGNGVESSTLYTYLGAYYHIGDRDFRGFNQTQVVGPHGPNGENATTITWFHQGRDTGVDENHPEVSNGYMKGRPYRTKVVGNHNKTYSESTITYAPDDSAPYFNPASEVISYICDGDECGLDSKKTLAFDRFGNLQEERVYGSASAQSPERRVVHTYAENSSSDKWIVSLPLTVELYDQNNALMAKKRIYYDGVGGCTQSAGLATPEKGNVTRIVNEHIDPLPQLQPVIGDIEIGMGYYADGNTACMRDARGSIVSIAETDYDTSRTFLLKKRNALGHETATKYYGVDQEPTDNGLYGQVKSITGPNGAAEIVNSQYDSFGRRIRVDLPDGTWQTWQYNNIGSIGTQHIQTTNSAGLSAWTYFDGLGRTFLQKQVGPDGKTIAQNTEYNNTGTVKRSSLPYYYGLESVRYVNFVYDSIGRVIQKNNPDATTEYACYDDGVITSIDAEGKRKREIRNAFGQLIKVEEYIGTGTSCTLNASDVYATTTYTYDAAGNLRFVTDAENHVMEMRYDSLGRKFYMKDPDMGEWYYKHDENGNLKRQKDANLAVITFDYDNINRLSLKTYPDAKTVQYVYDDPSAAYSKGRLTSMVDESGVTSYSYDIVGRVVTVKKRIDGQDYTVTTGYSSGRLSSISYPDPQGTDPLTVNHSYDGGGNLHQLSSSAQTFLTLTGYNALAQPGTATMGNGAATVYQYYQTNNRLQRITTTGASQTHLDITYDYYDAGNVKEIKDQRDNARSQWFIYDDLNRLVEAQSTLYGALFFSYNQTGNILSKPVEPLAGNGGALPSGATPTCPTGTALNGATGRCEAVPQCNSGTYSSSQNICMSESLSEPSCLAGSQLDITRDQCIAAATVTTTYSDPSCPTYSRMYSQFPRVDPTTDQCSYYSTSGCSSSMCTGQGLTFTGCKIIPAIGYRTTCLGPAPSCSVGTYDAFRNACALTTISCPAGLAYNSSTQDCVAAPVCASGTYDLSRNKCVSSSTAAATCPAGTTLNGISDKCEAMPTCSAGSYDAGQNTCVYNIVPATTYTYDGTAHALTSTSDGRVYQHDSNGNMWSDGLRTINYNYDNLPISITYSGITTTLVYDGNGDRVKKITPSGTTIYIGKLAECINGECTKYIFAGGTRIAAKFYNDINYYHQDHLGSTRVVTDGSGNSAEGIQYYPFGATLSDTGSNFNHRYTSQEYDRETGLYYYNARYYNPTLGRFISPDSIVPDPANPQALNRYSYVINNPVNYTDPSGHAFWKRMNNWSKKPWVAFALQMIPGAIAPGVAEFATYQLTKSKRGRQILIAEAVIATIAVSCGATAEASAAGASEGGMATADTSQIFEVYPYDFIAPNSANGGSVISGTGSTGSAGAASYGSSEEIARQSLAAIKYGGTAYISYQGISAVGGAIGTPRSGGDHGGSNGGGQNGYKSGYWDVNTSGGFIIGYTHGWLFTGSNHYVYSGGGLVTPGYGGSITWSSSAPTPGWNAALQVQFGIAIQVGYGFGPSGGWFGEVGGGWPPGASLTGYFVFEGRRNNLPKLLPSH